MGDMPPGTVLPEQTKVRPVRVGLLAVVAFLLICICVLVAFVMSSNSGAGKPSSTEVLSATEAAVSQAQAVERIGVTEAVGHEGVVYDLSSSDLLSVPGTDSVSLLVLSDSGVSTSSPQFNVSSINDAVSAIEGLGDCGFVFFDVNTGYGLTYNAGEEMYIASSAKAPFIYWLLTSGIELSEYDRDLVDWTITESDNASFETLFMQYYEQGYEGFMAGYDVHHANYYGDFYPRMCARNLSSVWADILGYIRGGSPDAEWLASLMGSTETSFIRNGLNGTGATVLNKAGWIDGPDYDGDYYYDEESGEYVASGGYVSVTDAAIVQADGRTYLMVIVTSQSDSDVAEANVSALARALFDVRERM